MPNATSMPPWMLAAIGPAALGGGQEAPGYYDLPGSRMLPGGRLAVSPGSQGEPRSMPGIDIPTAGDYVANPGTGIDYSDSLGLYTQPHTIPLGEMGGAGGGPAGQNIPPNDWFSPPNQADIWYPGDPNSAAAAPPSHALAYPRLGEGEAPDWFANASATPAFQGTSTPGSYGVGGQGGSFFTQSGQGLNIPGGIGFGQSGPGQNNFGSYFGGQHVGPMGKATYDSLRSVGINLGYSSYRDYLANYNLNRVVNPTSRPGERGGPGVGIIHQGQSPKVQ